jgi:predicted MPP superfamily phosphohydrolase
MKRHDVADLDFGNAPLLARIEHHHIAGAGEGAKLFYASDLHLRRKSEARVRELVALAGTQRPDVILLGGDLVDAPRGHEQLEALVRDLGTIAPVLAVSGNHDVFWGEHAVRKAVERGHGTWIVDSPVCIPTRGGRIDVCGSPEALSSARAPDARGARVICGHDPEIFATALAHGADLVFAGHLHGGQIVLAQRGTRLYPGAFFYRYCGLRFAEGTTTMLVSRGVADTVPVRYRCPREVIVCTVTD